MSLAEAAERDDHGSLDIPDGPWMADQWLMKRPARDATSGESVCIVERCPHPAGSPSGEAIRDVHALCLGHRRRRRKAGTRDVPLEQFVRDQAKAAPILRPRGAATAKEHFPTIDFTRVAPRFAEEVRWVTAVKILRNQWRDDQYVNQLLRGLIDEGNARKCAQLSDLASLIDALDGDRQPVLGRYIRMALPSMLRMLRYATGDRWQNLYWHPRDHGIPAEAASADRTVNWERVTCEWLQVGLMALSADRLRSGARSWGTIYGYPRAGALFSAYMEEVGFVDPAECTRAYFLDFLAWVRDSRTTRNDLHAVNSLARLLFDLREGGYVPDLPSTVYLLRGENPTTRDRKPKPFPDDILSRIDDLLADQNALDPDLRLILRVFRAVCPRPNEALTLPLDCVQHNPRGYTLEYYQWKISDWRRVPLPPNLGKDLAEQAERIRRVYPGCKYLFPYFGSSPRVNTLATLGIDFSPWPYHRFTDAIWNIYQRHGITASSTTGETLTGAQPHRFRHSIATGLLQEGWSQYEVQTFLGHKTPTMMQAYAEIHEDTLRSKYEEFIEHSVDVSGRHQDVALASLADVERLRDRMVRSALPNGYCTLPESQKCDFVPSPCLTCKPFFRTTPTFLPIHIRQRDESLRELELAKEAGHERAIEAHSRTVTALNAIIEGLEAESASAADQREAS